MTPEQKPLAAVQLEAFYHDCFVEDQIRAFNELIPPGRRSGALLDVGGGCGFFAEAALRDLIPNVTVLDADPASVAACSDRGISAILGDALDPAIRPEYRILSFNLILHHLVGRTENETRALQMRALNVWSQRDLLVFVNEYIYESFVPRLSGWIIYSITSSKFLSTIGRAASRIIPALHANTFGVGVRFRSHAEWSELFAQAGYRVSAVRIGREEVVSPVLRLLLIKAIRRDSFLLEPLSATT